MWTARVGDKTYLKIVWIDSKVYGLELNCPSSIQVYLTTFLFSIVSDKLALTVYWQLEAKRRILSFPVSNGYCTIKLAFLSTLSSILSPNPNYEGRPRKCKSNFSPGVSGASSSQITSITKTGKTAQLSSSSCACQLYFLVSHTQGEPAHYSLC